MFLTCLIILPVAILFVICATALPRAASAVSDPLELLNSGDSVAERYRPMERLLRDSDIQFLTNKPGFDSKRIRQARAQRRRIFRQYLRSLCGDFGALSLLVKALIVESSTDRPDLFRALLKTRMVFSYALLAIHLRLLAHAAGLSGNSIEVGSLTAQLDRLTGQALALRFTPEPLQA